MNLKYLLLFLIAVVVFSVPAFASVPVEERAAAKERINEIVSVINAQNFTALDQYLAPDARQGLKEEIMDKLYGIDYVWTITPSSYKDIGDNKLRVGIGWTYTGAGVSANGAVGYFIFEQTSKGLLLVDTNFHKMTSMGYVLKYIFIEIPSSWLAGVSSGSTTGFTVPIIIAIIIFIAIIAFCWWLIKRTAIKSGRKK